MRFKITLVHIKWHNLNYCSNKIKKNKAFFQRIKTYKIFKNFYKKMKKKFKIANSNNKETSKIK